MRFFFAFVPGFLFALGLSVSGMTDPARVLAFLDVVHRWDPTLLFVMGGAVAVYAVFFRLVALRSSPIGADRFDIPAQRGLDARLLGGSALFGIGWGLSGYCPGPALVSLASPAFPNVAFVFGLLAGSPRTVS
ncbi:MAG: YeeE/YedE family protein [Myxococcales bacterium]|nr:YeeE/YedE family protein [Myxococcales bacterium]